MTGREAFMACMTMTPGQARTVEDDPQASTTQRLVCRWMREEPVVFHELLEHVVGRPIAWEPRDQPLTQTPPVAHQSRDRWHMLRMLCTGRWRVLEDAAVEAGLSYESGRMCMVNSKRRGWTVEKRKQVSAVSGKVCRAYRLTPPPDVCAAVE